MPSSHAVARGLREVLVGEDPLQIDRLWQRLFHASDHYGRRGAALHVISAIDIALWDIAGKAAGRPGLRAARRPPPRQDPRLRERGHARDDRRRAPHRRAGRRGRLHGAQARLGPARPRPRVRRGARPRGTRDAWPGPRSDARRGPRLHRASAPSSCCAGWRSTASTGSRRRCSRTTSTATAGSPTAPTCASPRERPTRRSAPFRALVEHGHLDVLQPDIARCGGFTVARQIALLERSSAVEIVPHCFSTGVLVAASLHFVATLDRPTWSEYSVADSPLVNGILQEPFALEDGCLAVPGGPGLGVELDLRRDRPLPSGLAGPMAAIEFRGVTKRFPDGTIAVDDLHLRIEDGEFMIFVGPSGCGKTTALRMVAGLEQPTSGEILVGDTVVNDLDPVDRDIAMVFQNYALYPHMTVRANIGFPLETQRMPKPEREQRIAEAAALLGLEDLLDRKPRALSGGQRQRVAMGRAIVRHPQSFLMDEPLSNLDAKLRVQMRAELVEAPPAPRRDDAVRHPRPGRGDDARPARRRAEPRGRAAGRRAGRALQPPRQHLRGVVHRQPVDELPPRAERRPDDLVRRLHAAAAGDGRRRGCAAGRAR